MILVDGVAQSQVDATDRGLHYGDGLFETLAVFEGKIRCWADHWRRLNEGCQQLGLHCPEQALLEREVYELSEGAPRKVVKILLTRGSGPRGYRIPEKGTTRRILTASDWPGYPPQHAREGVRARLCQTRLGHNPALAGLKHCNRLEQVLARQEWQDEAEEGLMLDVDGNVIEGTMSNVFLVFNDALMTPDVSRCGVAGVTRQRIIDRSPELGIPVEITEITLERLHDAQALFLCNTLIGLWPVRFFDGRNYPLSDLLPALRTIDGLELS
ncbi:MAG: aminodeoxychorismate lyase [Gammaproteobacteria bacterium]|nr:aminodeoxychorismate lyase [Gammaproteobacteria bacterium]